MTPDEFKFFRDLPDKRIVGDVRLLNTGNTPDIRKHKAEVEISGFPNMRAFVDVTYKPNLPSLTVNFRVQGVGAICRYDVNGALHRDAVTNIAHRTHKHHMTTEKCPRRNLPNARGRSEFDLTSQTVQEIWDIVCREANVEHQGVVVV